MGMLLFEVPANPEKCFRGHHHRRFGGHNHIRHHPFLHSMMKLRKKEIMKEEENGFGLKLNVANYSPSELKIKVNGRKLTVEGEHSQENEHGSEMRKFQRTVTIPEEFDIDSVSSKLNQTGVLSITAPKLKPKEVSEEEKCIPIQMEVEKEPEQEKKNEQDDTAKEIPTINI